MQEELIRELSHQIGALTTENIALRIRLREALEEAQQLRLQVPPDVHEEQPPA
jgi:uncharacterized coiled-coil protein SlyX